MSTSTIEVVRLNNATPWIRVNLVEEPSDAALTEALAQIPTSIQQIHITVAMLEWPLLLVHLATRQRLEKVTLGYYLAPRQNPLVTEIQSFLQALQSNKDIRMVELDRLRLSPTGIARLLEEAPQLSGLALRLCSMEPRRYETTTGPLVLATALHRHPNLQSLELSLPQDAVYTAAILNSLRTNPVLQTLTLQMYQCWTPETYQSFQDLMRSTMSIRVLTIHRAVVADPHQQGGACCWNNKRDYLNLVERNGSLRNFTVQPTITGFFSYGDRVLLQRYLRRNARVHQFMVHPASVPKEQWAETLEDIAKANLSIRLECLRSATTELFGSNANQQQNKKNARNR